MTRTLKGDLASGGYKILDELRAIAQISTPTTLSSSHSTVEVTNGSDITLPAAASHTGRIFHIVRSGSSAVIIRTQALASYNPVTGPTTATPRGVWDFDDLTTLFQDTAGTSPVTTAGQNVKRANSLVAAAGYLSEGTNPPTWQTFGSYNGIQFNGTNQFLASNQAASYWKFLSDGTNGFTVVARVLMTDATPSGANCFLDTCRITGSNVGSSCWYSSGLYGTVAKGGGVNVVSYTSGTTLTNSEATLAWLYKYGITGNDLVLRKNGSDVGSSDSTTTCSSSSPAYTLGVGAGGAPGSTAYFLKGKIRRLAIYEGILDSTDLGNVETWVAAATTTYEQISGANTITLAAQYDKITVQSNGTTWLAI